MNDDDDDDERAAQFFVHANLMQCHPFSSKIWLAVYQIHVLIKYHILINTSLLENKHK